MLCRQRCSLLEGHHGHGGRWEAESRFTVEGCCKVLISDSCWQARASRTTYRLRKISNPTSSGPPASALCQCQFYAFSLALASAENYTSESPQTPQVAWFCSSGFRVRYGSCGYWNLPLISRLRGLSVSKLFAGSALLNKLNWSSTRKLGLTSD